MAVTNLNSVKEILGITTNKDDAAIAKLIPSVTNYMFKGFNNSFEILTSRVFIESSSLVFTNSTAPKISDTRANFLLCGFAIGQNIRIKGSALNDGVYEIKSITTTEITLSSDDELRNEFATYSIKITLVTIPREAELFIAKVIGHQLKAEKGLKSQRLGDWSATYSDGEDIPNAIMAIMEPYRRVYD